MVKNFGDTFSHLLQVHAVRGNTRETHRIFEEITEQFHMQPSVWHWDILLNAYVKANDYDGAIQVFNDLIETVKRSKFSY